MTAPTFSCYYAHDTFYNLVHFPFAAGIVSPVQNGLLLVIGHGCVGGHCVVVLSQSHAEANGDFVEIHIHSPFVFYR